MSAGQTDANRHRMLAEVRRGWIDGYLKHSLENVVRIELGLEETPDAVSRPWDLIVQQPDRAPRPLPPGQAMGTTFEELGQALLILGAPGAGKTTLLLELARDLLDRAVEDATHPIPVVFHLPTWAVQRRPLADWLVDELVSRPYYVPRKLAQVWVDAEQVLPLLDGLDEVAPEHRAACVEAINSFRRQYGWVPLAVCSRAADYQALPVRVELSGAIVLQPLSREQIRTSLKQAGKVLTGVRWVLRDDETLWELLETPLMLSIVALAYQGRSAAEVRATGSLEQRRTHLFENYTQRMFERRTKEIVYTREQTLHWLTWLARSLMRNNLSIFYVEWMQPDWLPSRAQRWILAIIWRTVIGLFMGLVVGLAVGLFFGLGYGLGVGLFVGLWSGQSVGLYEEEEASITPVEVIRWSWPEARNAWRGALVFGPALGLFFGLGYGLGVGLIVGFVFALACCLFAGMATDQIADRTVPNEGIRRSLRNALITLLTWGLVHGLFAALYFGLFFGLVFGLGDGLIGGIFSGLAFWLLSGLRNGGVAFLKHYLLRFLLWCNDYSPWHYIRFLDYAAERVFLRKVGGGYIFTHRLLMEYFATLPPPGQAGQSTTAPQPSHRPPG